MATLRAVRREPNCSKIDRDEFTEKKLESKGSIQQVFDEDLWKIACRKVTNDKPTVGLSFLRLKVEALTTSFRG